MEKYKDIVNFFQINGPNAKKVSMLGVEIIFLRKVREKRTKQVKNVRLYGVG